MNIIESRDEILQCLIAAEAVYDENPCEYIQKDELLKSVNKLEKLVRSSKEFIMRCYQPYLICTYAQKKIIISFRGTDPNSKNDIKTDLLIKYKYIEEFQGKVHFGFYLRAQLIPLDFFTRKLDEGYSLLLTGHSLGAAVASLIALKLLIQEKKKASGNVKNITFIGFGSPLIGDEAFAKFVNTSFKDHFTFIINENDLIPKLLYRDPTKEENELAKKQAKKSKKIKNPKNEDKVTNPKDQPDLPTIIDKKEEIDEDDESSIEMREQTEAATKLVSSVIKKVKLEHEKELEEASKKQKNNDENSLDSSKLSENVDQHSIISAEEISERELIESQIKQVEQEIMEQERLESQNGDSSDLIFKKKSENLKVFLRRLSSHNTNIPASFTKIDLKEINVIEEIDEIDNDTDDDEEKKECDGPELVESKKDDGAEKVETKKKEQIVIQFKEEENDEEIIKRLQEAEENMRKLNDLIDMAVAQNKDNILNNQKKPPTSLWNRISVRKTFNEVQNNATVDETENLEKTLEKVKKGSKSLPNVLEPKDQTNISTNKESNTGKSLGKKINSSKSEADAVDGTTVHSNETIINVRPSNKVKKRTIMKSMMKKLPRGTAFGFIHHILEEKNDNGKVIIIKDYDTETPDLINFYNQFKPKESQSKINYLKKNMQYHYIVNYKANLIKLVTNLLLENSFFITSFDECYLPHEISPEFYKLLCFKDKLSSVNLIIELKRTLANIEFIFDTELNVPELNLKIKLFEPFLVKPSSKKEDEVFVYNFLIKKSELKSMMSVNYSEINFYSHFNQATIKFPNTFFALCQPGFISYRSILDCNAMEITNGITIEEGTDGLIKIDDNLSKMSEEIVEDEEFWITHL